MTPVARTIFLGTGDFAVPVAQALAEHPSIDLALVVTSPTTVGSRNRLSDPPVADWAVEVGVPVHRPDRVRHPESIMLFEATGPDLLVLADYGQIVPQVILDLPEYGALNVHPSLLPRHRGATPVPAAILAGDSETGVTVMLMDAGLDTGPIVGQSRVPLNGDETAPGVEAMLAHEGAGLLKGLLPGWLAGDVEARPQPAEGATLTRPLRREDGRIVSSRGAQYLERQTRAYQPWPGTFFETSEGRVIVWRARPVSGTGVIGTLVSGPDGSPAVVTADGLLELLEVQPAGGRRMSGAELLRGRPALIGQCVG